MIVDGPDEGRAFPVAGATVLGRDRSAGIVVADPEVSRRHASVVAGPTGVRVEDLGSMNGTWVNGERIAEGRTLAGGDKLRVGTTVFRVELTASLEDSQREATKLTWLREPKPADREPRPDRAPAGMAESEDDQR